MFWVFCLGPQNKVILIKWCGFTEIVSVVFATISCNQKICESSVSVRIDGHLYLKKYKGLKKRWHFKIQRLYLPWSLRPNITFPSLPTSSPAFSASSLDFSDTGFFSLELAELVLFSVLFLAVSTAWNIPLQLFTSQVSVTFSVRSFLTSLASDPLLFWLVYPVLLSPFYYLKLTCLFFQFISCIIYKFHEVRILYSEIIFIL